MPPPGDNGTFAPEVTGPSSLLTSLQQIHAGHIGRLKSEPTTDPEEVVLQ